MNRKKDVEDNQLCFFLYDFLPQNAEYKQGFILSNYSVEKLDQHYLIQAIKLNINSNGSYWQYIPLIYYDENGTLPLWPPS